MNSVSLNTSDTSQEISSKPDRKDWIIVNLLSSIKGGMSVDKILSHMDKNPNHISILKRKEIKISLQNNWNFNSKYQLLQRFLETWREVNVSIFMILLDAAINDKKHLNKTYALFNKYNVSDPNNSAVFLIKYFILDNNYDVAKVLMWWFDPRKWFGWFLRKRETSDMKIDMIAIYLILNTEIWMEREKIIMEITNKDQKREELIKMKIRKLEERKA